MSETYEISQEGQVICKLLRVALGTEPMTEDGKQLTLCPSLINWDEVIRLSYKHKVSALAVDGLNISGFKMPESVVADSWLNDVQNTEASYSYSIEVLTTLCQIFRANGLKPIILKGYGLSLDYPIPSHRGSGDIDIYLIDEDGNPAAEKGNQIARSILGLKVMLEENEHHSQFVFKGITVENHYELMGANRRGKEELYLKQLLKKMAIQGNDNGIFILPSYTFNVIFMLMHMFTHFYHGQMSLRLLCDYFTLHQNHHNEIDWECVSSALEKGNMASFYNGVIGIITKYLKLDIKYSPLFVAEDNLTFRLIKDMCTYNPAENHGWNVFRHHIEHRWHYSFFQKKNVLESIASHCCDYIKLKVKEQ